MYTYCSFTSSGMTGFDSVIYKSLYLLFELATVLVTHMLQPIDAKNFDIKAGVAAAFNSAFAKLNPVLVPVAV